MQQLIYKHNFVHMANIYSCDLSLPLANEVTTVHLLLAIQ